jgi:hypothetical protein
MSHDLGDLKLSGQQTSTDLITPSFKSTVTSELKDSYRTYSAMPFKHRAAVAGVVGGLYGLATSHPKDQSTISTIMDVTKDAGVAIGAESAVNYIIKNHSNQISEFLDKGAGVSVGKIVETSNHIDVEKFIDKAKVHAGRAGWLTAGVGAFIGATALIGVGSKLERNKETERMQRDADLAMDKKTRRDKKTMSEMFGYNKHQPMGQLVMDMWDDRIGHHKMGNAKFQ